jgi:rhodanese-related sulfurtransferase
MTNSSTISRTELVAAIAAGDVTVVETLGPMYYESGHLPGAVNIPHTQVAELAADLLPDRDAAIVTYCSNPQCRNSSAVQAQLQSMGYSDVRKYVEGKDDWSAAGLPLTAGATV